MVDPYNGYEYVDLGLPSGLKWATCNVGADSPEKAGLYFAWGETTGYTIDDVTNGVRGFTKDEYNSGPAASISTNLTLEQDAAHIHMGGKWRMPTHNEFNEILRLSNTTVTWTTNYNGTGVAGRVITSKTNGNSIFLPAAGVCNNSHIFNVGSEGNYWSSKYNPNGYGYHMSFDSENFTTDYAGVRNVGSSLRGVCE